MTTATAQKILLIEDDRDLVDLYVESLGDAGYSVTVAFNGEEGLAKLKQSGFDLVLLDIMMPKVDGLEVLRQIKARPETAQTPVILLTNLDKDSVIKEGFSLGAAGYMVKANYNPGELVEEIKKFLKENPASSKVGPF